MSRKPKNTKLIWQIIPVLLICIAIATVFSGVAMYINVMNMFHAQKNDAARSLAYDIAGEIESTSNIYWLLDYWQDNYETMDIVWDDPAYLSEIRCEFSEANPLLDIDNISYDTLMSLSDESQKMYAEAAYMKLICYMDRLKANYNPKYFYCFTLTDLDKGNPNIFFLLTAKLDNEVRGNGPTDIYMLGHTEPADAQRHPILIESYLSGKEIYDLEQTEKIANHDIKEYHVYVPILENGQTRCMISVSLDATKIHDELVSKLIVIEILAAFIFFISVIAIVLLLRRMVINPISLIQTSVDTFGNDLDANRLNEELDKISTYNEIGLLAKDMGFLGTKLVDYIEKVRTITVKQERIDTELSLAKSIQSNTIPMNFDILPPSWGVQLSAFISPAKEVSGDFYDFYAIDDDHLVTIIADVSGKGIPAALFMMVSKILIETEFGNSLSPSTVIENVNNRLCQHNDADMFVTAWVGVLEISTGKLTYVNAGHEIPVIRRANKEFELYTQKHDFIIGGMPGIKYHEYEMELSPGDEIFIYTDGVAEANNENEDLFGTDRMLDALNSNMSHNATDIIQNVNEHIKAFVGDAEQFDDITMLSFIYK